MSTTITIGYDRRCWATFTVKDATPEELEVLGDDSTEALELARELDRAGRLEHQSEDKDDAPDYFGETSSVIELGEEA